MCIESLSIISHTHRPCFLPIILRVSMDEDLSQLYFLSITLRGSMNGDFSQLYSMLSTKTKKDNEGWTKPVLQNFACLFWRYNLLFIGEDLWDLTSFGLYQISHKVVSRYRRPFHPFLTCAPIVFSSNDVIFFASFLLSPGDCMSPRLTFVAWLLFSFLPKNMD